MEVKIIEEKGGLSLSVNGEIIAPVAYMTYIEDNARYDDFSKAGCKLFSACVNMGDATINPLSGVRCFGKHVWKSKDEYDFTPVHDTIAKVVQANPNAYLLLRVNVNAPVWWQEEYKNERAVLSDGTLGFPSIFSEKWKTDVEVFLTKLCAYLSTSSLGEHVVALQIAGMHTEEWMALMTATGAYDYSTLAQTAFEKPIPDAKDMANRTPKAIEYLRFFNHAFAETISRFCACAKRQCNRQWLVGAFYGYIGQLSVDRAHCAFSRLLDDDNVDFFASPFSYVDSRKKAKDWFYHGAMDSVALRKKLWFIEADVRTHLTKPLHETNPELMESQRTVDYFLRPVFQGVENEKIALWTLLRSYAKTLISQDAFWWFDMWGGWYDTPSMMEFMQKSFALYTETRKERIEKNSEIAVFLDENASYAMPNEKFVACSYKQLESLGGTGAPYDIYLLDDESKIPENKYKVKLYILPKGQQNALVYSGETLKTDDVFSASTIADALKKAGGHVFSEGNIVYANTGFVSVTATQAGNVTLKLPKEQKLRAFTTGKEYVGKEFTFDFAENQTELFKVIQ